MSTIDAVASTILTLALGVITVDAGQRIIDAAKGAAVQVEHRQQIMTGEAQAVGFNLSWTNAPMVELPPAQ